MKFVFADAQHINNSGALTYIAVGIILFATLSFVATAVIILVINKKQNEYVENNSVAFSKIKSINREMKGEFACLSNCDIVHYVHYKTKRSYDNFINSETRVLDTLFSMQDEIIKHTEWVTKNAIVKSKYDELVRESFNSSNFSEMKLPKYISIDRFKKIEKRLCNELILNPPTSFSLTIIAKYVSAKGYSQYEYKIPATFEDLVIGFKTLKRIDIVSIARRNLGVFSEESKYSFIDEIPQYKGKTNLSYVEELELSYKELVSFLLSKYGAVPGDYFSNETCRSKNKKISRTKEGLFIHHIDEDKAIMLSTDKFAVDNPYEYQRADRLVYCNILEHLILHIKITEEPRNVGANALELPGIGGAVNFICKQINDCYSDYEFVQPMMIYIREMIKDNFNDYILILKRLLAVTDKKPEYSQIITKREISRGFYGNVVERVYNSL